MVEKTQTLHVSLRLDEFMKQPRKDVLLYCCDIMLPISNLYFSESNDISICTNQVLYHRIIYQYNLLNRSSG